MTIDPVLGSAAAAVRTAADGFDQNIAMPQRRLVGSLGLLLVFLMPLNFMAVSPLLPQIIESYGISQATASLLVGLVSLILALGMLPGGMLAARFGVFRTLLIAAILVGAGVFTPLAPDFSVVLVLRAAFSVGAAMVIPASAMLIMQWFPSRELPIWNAASGAAQSVGMTVSALLSAPLAAAFGWRATLAIYGGVTLLGAGIWLRFGREHPAGLGPRMHSGEVMNVFRQRVTWLLALGFSGPIGQFIALTTWLPTYYRDARGFDIVQAGALVSLLTFVGIPGTLLGGLLPQRFGVRRPFILGCGALVGLAGMGSYLLSSTPLIVVALVVAGVCSMLYFPVLTTTAMELPGMTPSAVGVVLAIAIGAGNLTSFVSPFLVGLVADLTGTLVPGLLVCSVASLSLVVSGLLLPETGRRPSGDLRPPPATR